MSYKFNSSNCSLIDDTSTSQCSILAKLRRLKIEENLLINTINKINPKEASENYDDIPAISIYSSNLKTYMGQLKNTFAEIKNLFGDIKAVTDEKFCSVDIENMKRDVIKLDDKIRNFKSHIHFELSSCKSREEELIKQINDVEEKQPNGVLKTKTRTKPFTQIVPSPVKVIIQSPLKCKEVQQFQEFMMSSPNRYGGWNEYHHNVFVYIWNKYFNSRDNNDAREFLVSNHGQFQDFQREITLKISGSTRDDIITHCKWYCKYLYLKEQQQRALNHWKRNKRMLSKSQHKQRISDNEDRYSVKPKPCNSNGSIRNTDNVEELLDTMETHNAEEIANALCDMTFENDGPSLDMEVMSTGDDGTSVDNIKQKRRSISDILKPTKQWANRCNSSRESVKGYNDLDTIKKLRIPEWRLSLQD